MDGLHGTLEDIMRTLDQTSYNEATFPKRWRYSDNVQYSDSDDDDEEEEEEDEETIRNMFLGNGESSSEDDYTDDEYAVESSHRLHFRAGRTLPDHSRVQDLVEGDLEVLPDWFQWQTFQYSRLIVLPLLTGAPVVLLMGGEMLLAVTALGALATHLFYDAGLMKEASNSCMMSMVCALIVIVYNLIPLIIWRSPWYVILLVASVGYITLTGAWLLLLMKDFCRNDPHLSVYLEGMLFTIYPSVSIVLFTWAVSNLIGYQFSPYVLLVTGFIFYRIFVKPFASSFVDTEYIDEEKKIIIDPWSSASLAFMLMLAPSVLYVGLSFNGAATYTSFMAISMDILFILAVSFFVTTFLHLKPILEVLEISMEKIVLLRKLAVVVSIIGWTLGMHFHGYQSVLLPQWPVIFLCAWSLLGLALSKNQKMHSTVFTVNLIVLTVVLILQMPWSLIYTVGNCTWSIQHMYIAISINATVCILAVYSSKYLSSELFSCLIIIHGTVLSHQMALLFQSHLTSTATVILVHLFCVYFIMRMYHVKKILWQCALLSITVHVTSLLTTMEITYFSSNQNWLSFICLFCTQFSLVAVLAYVIVMEKSEVIHTMLFIKYVSSVGFLSLVSLSQQKNLLLSMSKYESSSHVILSLGIASLITSVPALKLTIYHRTTNNITWKVSSLMLITGAALVTVQPNVTADLFDVLRLLLFVSVISGCVLIALVHRVKSYIVLYVLCVFTGMPLGAFIYSVMFSNMNTLSVIMYGAQVSMWLVLGLTSLKPSRKTDFHFFVISISTLLLAVTMVISDFLSYGYTAGPGRVCAAVALLIVATAIKFNHIRRLPQVSKETMRVSHLPAVGNFSTVLCLFVLLSLTNTVKIPSDLWMLASTGVLFLLQRDDHIILVTNLNTDNHVTPSMATTVSLLVLLIVYHSPLLQPYMGFIVSACAVLELGTLLLTFPVFIVLCTVLWHGQFHSLGWFKSSHQAKCVLYLTPFFFCLVLMPISTTYRSWIYAVLGITSGTYLWQTKIPLSLI